MRVLLISSLPGLDPPCGDITYTETLLAHPPVGVVYETYAQALARGALIEHGRRSRFWKEPVLTCSNKTLNVLRRRRLLFWEPFRFFSVKPGEYDLVHLHVFSARFLVLDCPLVISSGAPQTEMYLDRRGYSVRRVQAMDIAERAIGRAMGVNCNSSCMPQASRVLVYTEHYRDYLTTRGYADAGRISVVPILLPSGGRQIARRHPKRIGFVARDFNEKGGPVVIDAFRRVREVRPDAELWIVGSPPQISGDEARDSGIVWHNRIPRDRLLNEVMPSFDIFAYPTPHDCFSYVMLEAMSCGVAIATSDYVSMPEAVDFGKAGLISPVGNAAALADNLLTLLDPETNHRFRLAARDRFEEHFSWNAVAPRLRTEYDAAIAGAVPCSAA